MDSREAIDRLGKLGWLPDTNGESLIDTDLLRDAVTLYQGFHGLSLTGILDHFTLASLMAVRFCSLPDVQEQRTQLCAWASPEIGWKITGSLPGVTPQVQQRDFENAWAAWIEGGIRPTMRDSGPQMVEMGAGLIDQPGGTLGWSEVPCGGATKLIRQQYDTAERWNTAVSLPTVAMHEIGHAIGLPHDVAGTLMAPTLNREINRPTEKDIAQARRRYPGPILPPGGPPPIPPDDGAAAKLKSLLEEIKELHARYRQK